MSSRVRPGSWLRSQPLLSRRGGAVLPKLDVAVFTQRAPFDELALLPHEILDRDLAVAEDVEVVAYDVSVTALRAGDQDAAVVVALLRDVVRRARAAGDAGEGELVGGLLGPGCSLW